MKIIRHGAIAGNISKIYGFLFIVAVLLIGLSLPNTSRVSAQNNNARSAAAGNPEEIRLKSIPWIEYEAELGSTNSTVIGPSRKYFCQEAEASGRKAVKLCATGNYVEIKSTAIANSIVIRYCIPDAAEGGGINATLSLYINDKHVQDLQLTSKYAWIYGDFPWSNDPSEGKAHRFYDESHAITPEINPGDRIRLQKDKSDTAAYYLIDLIDLEKIPDQIARPENSISIADYGAIANDTADDSEAIINCIKDAKAKHKIVWIPAGVFSMNTGTIPIQHITIRGAGMWYSILSGRFARFQGEGDSCKVSDLAMFGEIDCRIDESPDNAFNGYFGKGSEMRNLWIEHQKCGFWIGNYKNRTDLTDGMIISGCRIRNTMADGVNYCRGTKNSIVELSHLRNTGDDALATWSQDSMACHNIVFRYNTIQLPWLANCIALYGGFDHKVEYNLVADAVYASGGVNISSNFKPAPFGGTILVKGNTLIRCGSECYFTPTVGAIWIYCKDSNIDAKIVVEDNIISDATYSGISILGPKKLNNTIFLNNKIERTGTCGIDINRDAGGTATFIGTTITEAKSGGIEDHGNGKFIIDKGIGNSGW